MMKVNGRRVSRIFPLAKACSDLADFQFSGKGTQVISVIIR
jgi:hypothetical protein